MRIGVDPDNREQSIHIAKQTLAAVAIALERGYKLTPDAVRHASVNIVIEHGRETLAIMFPKEVDPNDPFPPSWSR